MFKRFFRRKSQPVEQPAVDYAVLFDQVMQGLTADWSAEQVQACLAGYENDEGFLQWLYRYDRDTLQGNPEPSVIERLQQWGAIDYGAVGQLIGEMSERAAQLRSPTTEPAKANPAEEILLTQGNKAYQQGNFTEAIAAYDQVLAMSPDHAIALSNKGASLVGLGQDEEAIATYDLALAITPDAVQVIYRKGNALRNIGRFEDAVAAYDAALAIKPDYEKALNNKGTALAALQRFEDAIVAYDGALAIAPQKYSCLNNKGLMLQQLGQFEDAIAAYDAALAINPKYSRARQNKEMALQRLNAG